jgi:hypothetical protein
MSNVDVLATLMELGVLRQLDCRLIVNMNRDSCKVDTKVKVINKSLKPDGFLNRFS